MQRRRTLILIVSLLAVLAAVLWINNPWTTMGNKNRKVSLRDTSSVDRILLVDAYDSTELIRVNDRWLLFGEEVCNQASVENLLIAASRLQITSVLSSVSPAEEAGKPVPARRIAWYKGRSEVLSFDFATIQGKHLITPPGADISYYVSVRGYPDLNLDRVFSSASNHYREHLLIDLLPSEISLINIELPDESLRFRQDSAGNIRMEVLDESKQFREAAFRDLAVRLLFSYFTSIRFEKKSGIASDSLRGSGPGNSPMATLRVSSFSGDSHSLRIYPWFESPGEEAHLFKALVIYNQEPEALLVNYIYLDVLMRGLSHYLGDK